MQGWRLVLGAVVLPSVAIAATHPYATGSGIWLGDKGYLLTNNHVAEGCDSLTAQIGGGRPVPLRPIALDADNDLALLQGDGVDAPAVSFRSGAPARPGDPVVALGFPLAGLLATEVSVTTGSITAEAGLGNDKRFVQISAPVQPGNSGGPLLDGSAHLVGIVSSKLNAMAVSKKLHDIPQNVNFAIKASVAQTFLDAHHVKYQTAASARDMSPADVADLGRRFTAYVECFHGKSGHHDVGDAGQVAETPPADAAVLAILPPPPPVGSVFSFHRTQKGHGKSDGEGDWTATVIQSSPARYVVTYKPNGNTATYDRNPFIEETVFDDQAKSLPANQRRLTTMVFDRGLDALFPLAPNKQATGGYVATTITDSGRTFVSRMSRTCTVGAVRRETLAIGPYDVWSVTCVATPDDDPDDKIEQKLWFAPTLDVLIRREFKTRNGRHAISDIDEITAVTLAKP